ncbi:MAG: serine hydrolase [Planctomycetota bacterium]|jgi:CubicO group peptidase (beta-lactamase class C family)
MGSACSANAICLAIFLSGTVFAQEARSAWPDTSWQPATAAEVGMDAALLEQARDYALTGEGSGMITRHGRAVMRWGDQKKTYDLKSSTKAVGVTAVGLALGDGKIGSLHEPAAKYHPEFGLSPQANAEKGWLDKITLFLLFEPGTQWCYSDGGPNWLAECVTLLYQRDLQELMFERVFGPIGIERHDLRWRTNAYRAKQINGVMRREFGSGIHANVNAMARIGYLYLRQGRWQDHRLIPSWFVDAARSVPYGVRALPVVKPADYGNASDHYGLLWWNNADATMKNVPRDTYWSWGLYDSLIIVIPSLDVVVARAGKSFPRGSDSDAHYAPIEPFVEPIAQSVRDRGRWPGAPYPPSQVIRDVKWEPPESITRAADGSDNWPITWADDDNLYTAYGDGWGFEPKTERKLSLGFARISGGPDDFKGANVRSETGERVGQGAAGPKASGMLCIHGTLYMLARNTANTQIAWSDDHAKTWHWCDWKFETSFGAPTFLNFGKDYGGARDDYVYIYSTDSDSAYEPSDRMVLARVPKDKIRRRQSYKFLAELDAEGRPLWTADIRDRAAVFVNPGSCYRSGISYNPSLGRYLWCQILPFSTDDRGPRFQGGFGIYEAPEPWGPWRTIFYTTAWDVGPGETAGFPTKWISPDGRTAHLLSSTDDAFSIRQATFLP